MKIVIEIEEPGMVEDCMSQISIIADNLMPDEITANMTTDSVNIEMNLHGNTKIVGEYDDEAEKMPTTVINNGKVIFSFNFHPYDSMGGLDKKAFEKEIIMLDEEITKINRS